jgi:hypothetical protein
MNMDGINKYSYPSITCADYDMVAGLGMQNFGQLGKLYKALMLKAARHQKDKF